MTAPEERTGWLVFAGIFAGVTIGATVYAVLRDPAWWWFTAGYSALTAGCLWKAHEMREGE